MITTDKKVQAAIINYYAAALTTKNINTIKSSRGGAHLRFSYDGDEVSLLNKILPCTVTASSVSISGSYSTQEITIKKAIPGARVGDKIYLVIARSSKGVLKTKQLTPDALGFAGKTISKNSFLKTVKSAIDKSSAPDNIKSMLLDLMSVSGTSNTVLKEDHIKSISDSDVNIIAKDFGELSGAYWFMNQFNKKAGSIKYPSASNAALVDYYAMIGKDEIAISAKANKGAPPSINAIADILRTKKYTNKDKEAARLAIIAISDNTTVDGIVKASMELSHPGYIWLKKNLFKNKDFSAADCETVLEKYKSPEELVQALTPFYTIIKRSASLNIAKRIFDTKAKRWGTIISPLGYSLVDILNTNSVFLSVLNDAANSIVVSQLYISINKSTKLVSYKVKEFNASVFKFEYNANAGQPSLKKISFKMD